LLSIGVEHLALEGMDFDRRIHVEERERWNRHRNEPWWVVGEQRHWPPPPFGEGRGSFFTASPFGEETGAITIVWALLSFFSEILFAFRCVYIYSFMLLAL